MCNKAIVFLCLLFWFCHIQAQSVDIGGNWYFKTGDSIQWSARSYNNKHWQIIRSGKSWEEELKTAYDGIAWYRKSVIIPATAKKEAFKTGYLTLELGKIDDADETFFNGSKIGSSGKFPPASITAWNTDRVYKIPISLIRWNQQNIIAVRVADWGGGGGLYSGNYVLEAAGWKQQLKVYAVNSNISNVFSKESPVDFAFVAENSGEEQQGTVSCEVKTFTDSLITILEKQVLLKKGKNNITFQVKSLPVGFYKTSFTFQKKDKSIITVKHGFSVAPEQAVAAPDFANDFDVFWHEAISELQTISPAFKMTLQNEMPDNSKYDTWLVEMKSLGNATVRGWYVVPKGKKNLPAILNVPGYSSEMKAWYGMEEAAIFHFNIRGHGNSKDNVNPGFPGYILDGIENKKQYIYRGAFMDCLRAVDFLCSRTEIDTTRIGVMGISQGGALSFATAALDKRIKCAAPDVPFLSDYPNYFKIAYWPGNEFKDYVAKNNTNWNDIYSTLSYFDIKNLAVKITCPLLMGVGLQDNICPPAINFAAYNNIKSAEKIYVIYPAAGHSLPEEHMKRKLKWMIDQLTSKK